MMPDEPPFLNARTAAVFLGVHPNTVRRWAHEQKLPGTRLGTRGQWLFPTEAVQCLLRNESAPGAFSERVQPAASQKSTPPTFLSSAQILGGGGEMDLLI